MKISNEQLAQLKKLKAQGKSNREVARTLGVHHSTVADWLNKADAPTENRVNVAPLTIEQQVDIDKIKQAHKAEITQLKRKYKEVIAESNQEAKIHKIIRESLQAIPPLPLNPLTIKINKNIKAVETAVLLSGDIHCGEIISGIQTLGLSSYDFEEYIRRTQYLSDTITNLVVNKLKPTFNKLVVAGLGDMVSGEIHDELRATNQFPITEAAIGGAYVYAQFLIELAQVFPEVEVLCCAAANHGRLYKKKSFKNKTSNWDYIFYELAAAYCANQKNITFKIPKSLFLVEEINGMKCLIIHGDDIRGWMGIPWYGIEKMITRLKTILAAQGHVIKYVFLGHFHQTGLLDDVDGEIIINGSMSGANEFAIGGLGKSTPPKQVFFGMHHIKGISSSYKINLKFTPQDDKIRYHYNENISVAEQR